MAHQQQQQGQGHYSRWSTRQSPPTPSHLATPTGSHSNSSSGSPDGVQYADYHPPAPSGPATPGGGLRSSPSTPHHLEDARLLASQPSSPIPADYSAALPQGSQRTGPGNGSLPTRSGSTNSFTPSPLNPALPHNTAGIGAGPFSPPPPSTSNSAPNPFSRASSSRPSSAGAGLVRHATMQQQQHQGTGAGVAEADVIATLGLGANSSGFPPNMGQQHGSMVLYRLADESRGTSASSSLSRAGSSKDPLLIPPRLPQGKGNRASFASSSGDSIVSLAESKYPATLGTMSSVRGLVPYAYDPALDESEPFDEEDLLHDPNPNAHLSQKYRGLGGGGSGGKGGEKGRGAAGKGGKGAKGRPMMNWEKKSFPWRGIVNMSVLLILVLGLLCLFVFYPVLTFYRDAARNNAIEGNIRINSTGQAPVLFQMPDLIDTDTPDSAKSRTGFDGKQYELVFSDEFNIAGRSFYPGDDPFWEAVDLWYGATGDLEWYDPSQITTRDGSLIITMDSTSTTQAGLTPGSTAPFTEAQNHGLDYRSGMLQSWNKFCFTTGYVEVSVTFPGPDQQTQGYWPGAWTMGNLARPGYAATTDGMWPYTYDSCDVGTFPNQTDKDQQGPAAALHSDASREKYNFELSWLSGQRLSACSCPGSDHPGPTPSKGRGAPEIDVFETEKDKDFATGQVVSQSAQFAPFSHDYIYYNDSGQWSNFNPGMTRANTYRGSAVQQAVSALTRTPTDIFQGSGANYHTFGFEYWSDPNDRNAGTITWQADGQKTHQVLASAVAPDQGTGGSGVGQRLIPEEPMSLVLNLGISPNWQTIDLSSMQFPAEMKVDYIRVYQRKGQTNTGCSPKNYPTADYINSHLEAYTNVNMTTWKWQKPKNSLYDGC
ncbi:hypothetical protein GALMADRAFT_1243340 [Galerina marginata CBS 339.88]|uniref:GH16 domain-containing protein n=1 Tax=Galerina marginata (strain CBS 339.88) TaxID=685588 RepID=A0A067T8K1_GALM3|nr:hypothetical protein GALMADRAFT_1243340 [Galerina marginata CBS 339.88]